MIANLTTERLSLQALTTEDFAFIQELVNTEGWLRFIGDRSVHSKEDAIGYINKINSAPNIHYWVVRLLENQAPIGVVTFIKRDYLDHFDIGFAFLPPHNGKGYAYEAANKVLATVRLQPEHAVVLATTLPDNTPSIKLLTRLGLHFEKELAVDGKTVRVYSTASKT